MGNNAKESKYSPGVPGLATLWSKPLPIPGNVRQARGRFVCQNLFVTLHRDRTTGHLYKNTRKNETEEDDTFNTDYGNVYSIIIVSGLST